MIGAFTSRTARAPVWTAAPDTFPAKVVVSLHDDVRTNRARDFGDQSGAGPAQLTLAQGRRERVPVYRAVRKRTVPRRDQRVHLVSERRQAGGDLGA